MSEIVEYKGFEIKIEQDSHPLNPRIDWDNGTKMVCFHGKYNLGDKHEYKKENYDSWDELKADIVKKEKPIVILPLFLYDHSGITMSTSTEYPFNCRWDSMMVGFIYVTKSGANEMGWTKKYIGELSKGNDEQYKGKTYEEILTGFLVSDVKVYDQYITGEVYRFEIEDCDDYCGGFFGYDHEKYGLLDEAKAVIEGTIRHRTKKRIEKVKEYIKAGIPIIYRKLPAVV